MGSKVFERKNRVYDLKYSDDISKICKPYKIVSNVAWFVVVIALVEPRVLLPTFLLSLLIFFKQEDESIMEGKYFFREGEKWKS